MLRIIIKVALIGVLISQVSWAKSKITFDDLYGFPQLKNVVLSPTDEHLAVVYSEYDIGMNSRTDVLQILKKNGYLLASIQGVVAYKSSPRWSPDGSRIAYLTTSDGQTNIQSYDIVHGTTDTIVKFVTSVDDFIWSPDGKAIVFAAATYPECGTDENCIQAVQERESEMTGSGQLYDQLLFRHYSHWNDRFVQHIFWQDLSTGSQVDLTPGDTNAPGAYLGGDPDLSFSPDSKFIAFTMNTDPELAVSTNNDIFSVSRDGKNLTRISSKPGNDTDPKYSPDGDYLAYLEMARAGYESDQRDLIVLDSEDKYLNLTSEFDRSLDNFSWSRDSKSIYVICGDRALSSLYKIDLAAPGIKRLFGGVVIQYENISSDGKYLYCSLSEPQRPAEVFRVNLKNSKRKQLTEYSQDLVSNVDLSPAETFWFAGAGGDSVMGILTFPPDFKQDDKYPFVLLIHGGPQYVWYKHFNFYGWNTQLLAANGYIVAQINPHGSATYGLKFKETVSGDWGGMDFEDLMLGVDYLTQNYSSIDTARMGALGRSYGGFMINWINGHDNRFKCLISIDGSYDQISAYYSTEELWFPEWDFKGTPITNRELYIERSPSTYAGNFKTPTLVIHGAKDYRVDLSQGLSMFTALRSQGIPAQLLYYPDEGHSIKKIHNLKQSYEIQLNWLSRWLKE